MVEIAAKYTSMLESDESSEEEIHDEEIISKTLSQYQSTLGSDSSEVSVSIAHSPHFKFDVFGQFWTPDASRSGSYKITLVYLLLFIIYYLLLLVIHFSQKRL